MVSAKGAKAAGLKARGPRLAGSWLGEKPEWGLPTKSGREAVPVPLPTPALSLKLEPLVTENGLPVCATVMPEICHPPRTLCTKPDPLKKGRA